MVVCGVMRDVFGVCGVCVEGVSTILSPVECIPRPRKISRLSCEAGEIFQGAAHKNTATHTSLSITKNSSEAKLVTMHFQTSSAEKSPFSSASPFSF